MFLVCLGISGLLLSFGDPLVSVVGNLTVARKAFASPRSTTFLKLKEGEIGGKFFLLTFKENGLCWPSRLTPQCRAFGV